MSSGLDISNHFKPSLKDSKISKKILRHEGTGQAILEFNRNKSQLSDYAYWFLLGTLWVSYSGWSDLDLWKALFLSKRANRDDCLMKPSELLAFQGLPSELIVYRAKRLEESDCIAYTLSKEVATAWALRRKVTSIHQFYVNKKDVIALFLRRNEQELIILDRASTTLIGTIPI